MTVTIIYRNLIVETIPNVLSFARVKNNWEIRLPNEITRIVIVERVRQIRVGE